MQATCQRCGKAFPAQRSTAKWCSNVCRQAPAPLSRKPEAPPAVGSGVISGAVRAELAEVGRLETSAGQRALHLAVLLEAPRSESGSATAALDKQLAAAMEQALDGAKRKAHPMDELTARRERRNA